MSSVRIRIAGNTGAPCLAVIQAKGYKVTLSAQLRSDDTTDIGYYDFCAEKDDLFFSATNLEELLGLITLGENRGDNWKANDGAYDHYQQLWSDCILYDKDGNIVKE